jgi:phosphoribosylformylglycinamidine synthase
LPVRHGEGKFIPQDDATLNTLREKGQIALRYCHHDGMAARGSFPANPNGSADDVAGICDPTGRVFGLMPHPEAFVDRTHHPRWTREDVPEEGTGLRIFRNAVEYARETM